VSAAFAALKGTATPENPLTLAKTIIELGQSIGGNGNGADDNVYSIVKEIGKEAIRRIPPEAIAAFVPAPAVPPPAALPPAPANVVSPIVSPPPPAAAAIPSTPQEVDLSNPAIIRQFIALGLEYLKRKAKKANLGNLEERNESVELVLDWMCNNDEEPQFTAIMGAIKQGATFENLLQFDPEIATNPELQAWFKKLYDGLRAEIFNPMDTGRAARDENHSRGDEGGSPKGPQVSTPGQAG
jgi:hypothetical protein